MVRSLVSLRRRGGLIPHPTHTTPTLTHTHTFASLLPFASFVLFLTIYHHISHACLPTATRHNMSLPVTGHEKPCPACLQKRAFLLFGVGSWFRMVMVVACVLCVCVQHFALYVCGLQAAGCNVCISERPSCLLLPSLTSFLTPTSFSKPCSPIHFMPVEKASSPPPPHPGTDVPLPAGIWETALGTGNRKEEEDPPPRFLLLFTIQQGGMRAPLGCLLAFNTPIPITTLTCLCIQCMCVTDSGPFSGRCQHAA